MSDFEEDLDFEEFDFIFDENAQEYYQYYVIGIRPIRITIFNKAPVLAESVDFDKKTFGIDNTLIKLVTDSLEIERVDENTFRNACLAIGVKPI